MRQHKTYLECYGDEERLPWEMVLVNVPEPDPGKLDFRKEVCKRPMHVCQETKLVNKLIEHLDIDAII